MKRTQWLTLTLALLTCATLFGYLYPRLQPSNDGPRAGQPPARQETAETAIDVSVMRVTPAVHTARIQAYGEVAARHRLDLVTQVAGRVRTLEAGFENGRRVAQGAPLLQLDDSDYRAAVAGAEKALTDARLALLEEQRQGVQARAEWEASGLDGTPDSALVLRQPQLDAARAAVASADAALDSARRDLAQTRLSVPFDAVVVERLVSPGGYLPVGTPVATLYSTDRAEVRVALSARDWLNLPDEATLGDGAWPATLTDVETGRQWSGQVARVERHLDDTTRQRALVLAVDHPLDQEPALLPGTFVQASIAGAHRGGLWKLPATALSQRGAIWYLSDTDTLASIAVTPAFSTADAVYVPAPEALGGQPQRVLVHPLNGYLEGTRVKPIEVQRDE